MKVWVLTYEVNDYDQHGEYFEAVYGHRPTLEQLLDVGGMGRSTAKRLVAGVSGREGTEHMWWHLHEFDLPAPPSAST